eukprot:TRINITY_DN11261_c0_g1_i2.p1 TRINITY_DN11261_c0_g1~~TRINITY_DN11261_c0_g1_i2.p1  ORF type:complete len:282 (-),score=64.01 TRINITY_DN11261_c0_g1_i2:204-998(-)
MDPCCAAGKKIHQNEEKVGVASIEKAMQSDLDLYIVEGSGPLQSTAIVVVYDIFGFKTPNMITNCHYFAQHGYTVCMPDFYHGDTALAIPELTPESISEFVRKFPFETCVLPALHDLVIPHLKLRGIKKLFMIGFCWGGLIALRVSTNPSCGEMVNDQTQLHFSAVGGIHASLKDELLAVDLATKAKCHVLLIQAGNDRDVVPVKKALDSTPLSGRHLVRTYFDQLHGFAGARGNRSDPLVLNAALSALSTCIDYFELVGRGAL